MFFGWYAIFAFSAAFAGRPAAGESGSRKKALEKDRKSIFEVMHEVGYADDKAFREVFKKIAGVSPLDYRAKYNKEGVLG